MGEVIRLGAASVAALTFAGEAQARPLSQHTSGRAVSAETQTEKYYPSAPKGVKNLLIYNDIQAEAERASGMLTHEWEGAVVLHRPKIPARVAFNVSPHAYDYAASTPGAYLSVEPNSKNGVLLVKPRILKFEGRIYLAAYFISRGGSEWGYLDVAWAKQVGALSSYDIQGIKAQSKVAEAGGVPYYQTPTFADSIDPLHGVIINNKIAPVKPGPTPHL